MAGATAPKSENAAQVFLSLAARCIWPSGVLSKFGVAWSAWSCLNLLWHAFSVGFGQAFQVALGYSDRALGELLRPLASLLTPLLLSASERLGLPFELQPHWKYLFVLIGLYVFRSAAVVWERGDHISALFRFFVGACAALFASAIAGSIPVSSNDRYAAFLTAAIPLVGVFLYNVLNAVWDGLLMRPVPNRLRVVSAMSLPERMAPGPEINRVSYVAWNLLDHLLDVAKRYAFALLFVIGVLYIPGVLALPSPGVIILAALVGFVAILNIANGALYTAALLTPGSGNEDTPWVQAFQMTSSGRLGMSMLAVVFWTVVFVVGNAGLGLVGL